MKLLVIQTGALGFALWENRHQAEFWKSLKVEPVASVFPALKTTVQASFKTGLPPSGHGIVADCFYANSLCKVFHENSSAYFSEGSRIWNDNDAHSQLKTGQIFWSNAINESDVIVAKDYVNYENMSAPYLYVKPDGLSSKINASKFKYKYIEGPSASIESSRWIVNSALNVLKSQTLDLLFVYIPNLDIELTRHDIDTQAACDAFAQTEKLLEQLYESARFNGYEILIFGDYAVSRAEKVLCPNRILKESGFLSIKEFGPHQHPDFYASKAFAVTNYQTAHVYVREKENIMLVRKLFEGFSGIKKVHPHEVVNHSRAGELILEASPGCWFAYNWWSNPRNAPSYASICAQHMKPGMDPCEFTQKFSFFNKIDTDLGRIKNTHGNGDFDEASVLWASSFEPDSSVSSIISGAQYIKKIL